MTTLKIHRRTFDIFQGGRTVSLSIVFGEEDFFIKSFRQRGEALLYLLFRFMPDNRKAMRMISAEHKAIINDLDRFLAREKNCSCSFEVERLVKFGRKSKLLKYDVKIYWHPAGEKVVIESITLNGKHHATEYLIHIMLQKYYEVLLNIEI